LPAKGRTADATVLKLRKEGPLLRISNEQEATRVAPARGPPLWEAADAEHDPAADPRLPPIPVFEFDPRLCGQPSPSPSPLTRCAPAGTRVPTPTHLPARSHLGVATSANVPPQACGAARCRRQSTLDPRYRLFHPQAGALELAIH